MSPWPLRTLLPLGLLLAQLPAAARAARENPVRKVINLLQMVDKKVSEEGAQREKQFDAIMCYYRTMQASLQKSVASAEFNIPQFESRIQEDISKKQMLEQELLQLRAQRNEAQQTLDSAKVLQAQATGSLKDEVAELTENTNALSKAILAIEKGSGGSFLQASNAQLLQKLSLTMDMAVADRDMLAAFIGGAGGQTPPSAEILGILKQLHDTMTSDLAKADKQLAVAMMNFESLLQSKRNILTTSIQAIEERTRREGELAVEIAQLKHELADFNRNSANDQHFFANSLMAMKQREEEWNVYLQVQSQETITIMETIKLLNEDDATELFKKTLPSPAVSFLQLPASGREVREQALAKLRKASTSDPRVNLLEMAVRGQKVGFDQLVAKLDELSSLLKEEQTEDDRKKAFCESMIDKAEDETKAAHRTALDTKSVMQNMENSLDELIQNIDGVTKSIADLDKHVAEATAMRKQENSLAMESLATNNAAMELLEMAKNKLLKFYGPRLIPWKPAAALSQRGSSSKQQAQQSQQKALAERFGEEPQADFAYEKKTAESGGAIAMMNLLKELIVKKTTMLQTQEQIDQEEYQKVIEDSAAKRRIDVSTLATWRNARAELEADLHEVRGNFESHEGAVATAQRELSYLHRDCDWLLQNFKLRQEARLNELEAMQEARAVLSGADYSL